ncbi:unnamed protein product [Amoebophrya sp. A120]|nr:unnamed protein product [Amoebophrya sp. A120]|eukprot:GSA120T00014082001.1
MALFHGNTYFRCTTAVVVLSSFFTTGAPASQHSSTSGVHEPEQAELLQPPYEESQTTSRFDTTNAPHLINFFYRKDLYTTPEDKKIGRELVAAAKAFPSSSASTENLKRYNAPEEFDIRSSAEDVVDVSGSSRREKRTQEQDAPLTPLWAVKEDFSLQSLVKILNEKVFPSTHRRGRNNLEAIEFRFSWYPRDDFAEVACLPPETGPVCAESSYVIVEKISLLEATVHSTTSAPTAGTLAKRLHAEFVSLGKNGPSLKQVASKIEVVFQAIDISIGAAGGTVVVGTQTSAGAVVPPGAAEGAADQSVSSSFRPPVVPSRPRRHSSPATRGQVLAQQQEPVPVVGEELSEKDPLSNVIRRSTSSSLRSNSRGTPRSPAMPSISEEDRAAAVAGTRNQRSQNPTSSRGDHSRDQSSDRDRSRSSSVSVSEGIELFSQYKVPSIAGSHRGKGSVYGDEVVPEVTVGGPRPRMWNKYPSKESETAEQSQGGARTTSSIASSSGARTSAVPAGGAATNPVRPQQLQQGQVAEQQPTLLPSDVTSIAEASGAAATGGQAQAALAASTAVEQPTAPGEGAPGAALLPGPPRQRRWSRRLGKSVAGSEGSEAGSSASSSTSRHDKERSKDELVVPIAKKRAADLVDHHAASAGSDSSAPAVASARGGSSSTAVLPALSVARTSTGDVVLGQQEQGAINVNVNEVEGATVNHGSPASSSSAKFTAAQQEEAAPSSDGEHSSGATVPASLSVDQDQDREQASSTDQDRTAGPERLYNLPGGTRTPATASRNTEAFILSPAGGARATPGALGLDATALADTANAETFMLSTPAGGGGPPGRARAAGILGVDATAPADMTNAELFRLSTPAGASTAGTLGMDALAPADTMNTQMFMLSPTSGGGGGTAAEEHQPDNNRQLPFQTQRFNSRDVHGGLEAPANVTADVGLFTLSEGETGTGSGTDGNSYAAGVRPKAKAAAGRGVAPAAAAPAVQASLSDWWNERRPGTSAHVPATDVAAQPPVSLSSEGENFNSGRGHDGIDAAAPATGTDSDSTELRSDRSNGTNLFMIRGGPRVGASATSGAPLGGSKPVVQVRRTAADRSASSSRKSTSRRSASSSATSQTQGSSTRRLSKTRTRSKSTRRERTASGETGAAAASAGRASHADTAITPPLARTGTESAPNLTGNGHESRQTNPQRGPHHVDDSDLVNLQEIRSNLLDIRGKLIAGLPGANGTGRGPAPSPNTEGGGSSSFSSGSNSAGPTSSPAVVEGEEGRGVAQQVEASRIMSAGPPTGRTTTPEPAEVFEIVGDDSPVGAGKAKQSAAPSAVDAGSQTTQSLVMFERVDDAAPVDMKDKDVVPAAPEEVSVAAPAAPAAPAVEQPFNPPARRALPAVPTKISEAASAACSASSPAFLQSDTTGSSVARPQEQEQDSLVCGTDTTRSRRDTTRHRRLTLTREPHHGDIWDQHRAQLRRGERDVVAPAQQGRSRAGAAQDEQQAPSSTVVQHQPPSKAIGRSSSTAAIETRSRNTARSTAVTTVPRRLPSPPATWPPPREGVDAPNPSSGIGSQRSDSPPARLASTRDGEDLVQRMTDFKRKTVERARAASSGAIEAGRRGGKTSRRGEAAFVLHPPAPTRLPAAPVSTGTADRLRGRGSNGPRQEVTEMFPSSRPAPSTTTGASARGRSSTGRDQHATRGATSSAADRQTQQQTGPPRGQLQHQRDYKTEPRAVKDPSSDSDEDLHDVGLRSVIPPRQQRLSDIFHLREARRRGEEHKSKFGAGAAGGASSSSGPLAGGRTTVPAPARRASSAAAVMHDARPADASSVSTVQADHEHQAPAKTNPYQTLVDRVEEEDTVLQGDLSSLSPPKPPRRSLMERALSQPGVKIQHPPEHKSLVDRYLAMGPTPISHPPGSSTLEQAMKPRKSLVERYLEQPAEPMQHARPERGSFAAGGGGGRGPFSSGVGAAGAGPSSSGTPAPAEGSATGTTDGASSSTPGAATLSDPAKAATKPRRSSSSKSKTRIILVAEPQVAQGYTHPQSDAEQTQGAASGSAGPASQTSQQQPDFNDPEWNPWWDDALEMIDQNSRRKRFYRCTSAPDLKKPEVRSASAGAGAAAGAGTAATTPINTVRGAGSSSALGTTTSSTPGAASSGSRAGNKHPRDVSRPRVLFQTPISTTGGASSSSSSGAAGTTTPPNSFTGASRRSGRGEDHRAGDDIFSTPLPGIGIGSGRAPSAATPSTATPGGTTAAGGSSSKRQAAPTRDAIKASLFHGAPAANQPQPPSSSRRSCSTPGMTTTSSGSALRDWERHCQKQGGAGASSATGLRRQKSSASLHDRSASLKQTQGPNTPFVTHMTFKGEIHGKMKFNAIMQQPNPEMDGPAEVGQSSGSAASGAAPAAASGPAGAKSQQSSDDSGSSSDTVEDEAARAARIRRELLAQGYTEQRLDGMLIAECEWTD